MSSREKVEFDVVGRDSGGSRAFRQVGDAAAKAGDQVDDLGRQFRGLDAEIAGVEGNVRRLATEIDRTGNKELFKDLRKQQSELRKLTRVRDLLPGDDETHREAVRFGGRLAEGVASGLSRAGGPIAGALSKAFGTLPPQAQVAIGAGVVGAAVAAAPAIGAVMSGAVVGAAGVGGILGGVAIAAKHPQVQAAAKLTGDAFTQELQRAAVSFVPATVESLSIVRSEIGGIGDDLERAFSAGSGMLPGLTEKAMGGARRAVEGFATAVERSGPVVDAVGTIVERLGDVVGDTFEGMSEHSSEGAHALLVLWGVFELGIRSVAGTIEMLTVAYGWLEKFGALLSGDAAKLGRLIAEQEVAKGASGGLSEGMQVLIAAFTKTGNTAASAAVEIESLNDMVKRLSGENISAEQASIRLEEAIDRATAAGKKNNDGIDRGTAKGRENRKLLVDLADASNNAAEKIKAQTGSTELASAATERGRAKFLEAARAMKVEKGEAERLANQLFGIPNIERTVKVNANTQPAIDSARGVVARINNMSARIDVYAEPHGSFGGSAHTGFGYSTGYSEGGRVLGRGTDTSDSVVRRVSRDEFVVRARAARHVGYDFLNMVNQADRRPGALGQAAANSTGSAARGRGGGIDEARLASAIARAMSRMTLRLDDRTGNYATLLSRGDG